ncbi:hypothetical protein A2955_01615 [Candidatus Woesebacteria bacterium RIFCSPLOWO2_01_FULL_37_19]|uniref:Uncharacterized protein n=1 Tax=Candidatus Woesebacteria bacterium RIFCSPLOWO2_01_FULL_37_19 TaxID=1802514 RepID=A0A1F8BAG9_9BACT|nr:MAG: hypothetical protein A2955_01615 [Candidatus Woesebacteria bacterium RIFCSPLOWO2_01_FULL_37_19]
MSELTTTYPYPERGSTFFEKIELPAEIPLAEGQKKEIYNFEEPLYEKLRQIKLVSKEVKKRSTYPEVDPPTEIRAREVFIEEFKKEFLDGDGNVENVPNPKRVVEARNTEKLLEELIGLRGFKKDLKLLAHKIVEEEKDPDLREAKLIVTDLYRRYINLQTVERYEYGAIITNQETKSDTDLEILKLLTPGVKGLAKEDRFAPDNASKTLQRIDRFIYGMGMHIDPFGELHFRSVTDELEDYAEEKLKQIKPEKDEDLRVNAEQQVRLTGMLFEQSGRSNWGYILEEGRTRMDVRPSKEMGDKVLIGDKFNRTPASAVKGASMEGVHALRIENRRNVFEGNLRLYEKYAGRYSALMAAAEEYVAGRATEVFGSQKWEAMPYIYAIVKKRSQGASFREGFIAGIEARAKLAGKNVTDFVRDAKDTTLEGTFANTLSVWGRSADLEEYSSNVAHTGELSYLEGELIAKKLEGTELWPILFLSGPDLYTICDLTRLGFADFRKAKALDMSFMDKVVVPFKEELDRRRKKDASDKEKKRIVDEALDSLEKRLHIQVPNLST